MSDPCIHDTSYRVDETTHEQRGPNDSGPWKTRVAWCEDCGALLWTEQVYRKEGEPEYYRAVSDETYDLLYTRAGQKRLMREAVAARGLRIPRCWEEF